METTLRTLYRHRLPELVEALTALPVERGLSLPLAISLTAHDYLAAPVKLMVLGQQTYCWGSIAEIEDAPDPVELLVCRYQQFRLGDGPIQLRHAPFWRAAHQLYQALNPEGPAHGFLWNNIVKVDEGGMRPGADVEDLLVEHFNVVPGEVAIADPDVVVMFTGPHYEDSLEATFPGLRATPIGTHPLQLLARLQHPALPPLSFRTYPPGYLARTGRWSILDELADLAGAPRPQAAPVARS